MSKVIVMEGLDGAGKTTAINAITCELDTRGIAYEVLREPGGTQIGEWLRHYVKSLDTPVLDPKSETLLFFLSRSVLVNDVIRPLLAQGTYVILDRFYRSTKMYQGYASNPGTLPLIDDLIKHLELDNLIDLEILMDVDVETSMKRIDLRYSDCKIEARGRKYFETVRAGYLADAAKYDYIRTVNANESMLTVANNVRKVLIQFLEETRPWTLES